MRRSAPAIAEKAEQHDDTKPRRACQRAAYGRDPRRNSGCGSERQRDSRFQRSDPAGPGEDDYLPAVTLQTWASAGARA